MRRRERIASLGSILAVWPLSAPGQTESAQTWPTRPVKVIVGFAPGGPTDLVARLVAQKLTEATGKIAQPDVKAKLAAMAYVPIGSTPQKCAEFFQSEMAKWGPVIKQAGLKAE